MRAFVDPIDPTPDERGAELLAAFALEEVVVCQWLRFVGGQPEHIQRGLLAGRLRRSSKAPIRKVRSRLAFRLARLTQRRERDAFESPGTNKYVAIRNLITGAVVRLPFA
ncbi:MAG TPA: hypothetical protein VLT47_11205 [Anaeromyxobacteraceae bacterium]|nr:hypothetical protein [Anaeromyxobacteraceae bacterium]